MTIVQHQFKPTEFRELRGFISTSALEVILSESNRANSIGVDASACGCVIRYTHGLPCAHEIAEYKRESSPIPLESVDPYWKKLDLARVEKKPTADLSCQSEFERITKHFNEKSVET